jgi:hypothetical protein
VREHRSTAPAYLVAHVHEALATDPECAELGIEVTVTGDRLFLNGTVSSVEQRDRASVVAAACAPEHTIYNDLDVLHTATGGPDGAAVDRGHGEPERLT